MPRKGYNLQKAGEKDTLPSSGFVEANFHKLNSSTRRADTDSPNTSISDISTTNTSNDNSSISDSSTNNTSNNNMSSPDLVQVASANKLGACPAVQCGDPKASKSGLIVLQEWWGLNAQIKACGQEIADGAKMAVLVPDLYRGKVATDNEEAGHYMGDLDWMGAVEDIRGCAQFLKAQGCHKVGVTGFCMGGALSMAAAALVKEVDAAAPFYGIPSAQLCDVTTISVPLQCHFGERDSVKGFSSPDEWKPLQVKLTGCVEDLEFYVYDAEHAFTNKTGANYNPDLASQAFSRMYEFFQKRLA